MWAIPLISMANPRVKDDSKHRILVGGVFGHRLPQVGRLSLKALKNPIFFPETLYFKS
jgi:hypothetical protein